MDNIKRWLVPLRLDQTDDALLAYVAYMAARFEPEAIDFLHIAEVRSLPMGFGHFSPSGLRLFW